MSLSAVLLALASCVPSSTSDARTAITTRIVATVEQGPVTLVGMHLGLPSAERSVVVKEASGQLLRIPATSPSILSWLDRGVTLRLPAGTTSGSLVVETPSGRSQSVELDVYGYDTFPVPPTPGTNASPLAVAVDATGSVWLNQEFHLDSAPLAVLERSATELTLVDAPAPPGPGPFATRIFSDQRTHITELGEDILVDPTGRVWLSEGGGLLYNGTFPNHSRIVRYDPASPAGRRIRVYNLPGDDNEVIGLAWDAARGRLWLAEAGGQAGPRLLSFDPEKTPFDNAFDFSRSQDSLLHSGADTDQTGYRVYPLPESGGSYPAHLLLQADGSIWYTAYVGNSIGHLDPATGIAVLLPLPRPTSSNPAARAFGTTGPWDILAAPDGGIVFNSQFENTVSRLDPSRIRNISACLRLDGTGQNPCLRTIAVPGADLSEELLHSAAFDAVGRLWFTQHSSGPGTGAPASIGFVDPGWSSLVLLPTLPGQVGDTPANAANDGIAIDPRSGDIWFAEYLRHRVGRLHRV